MLKLLSGYLVKKKALWSLKVSKSDGCRKKEITWEKPNKINIVVLVTLEKKKKRGGYARPKLFFANHFSFTVE